MPPITAPMLAACYRLMDTYGMTDLIYNHISAKVPGTNHFLVNLYGLLYKEITASSLVKLDEDGEIIWKPDTDYTYNRSGYVIHGAIHAARPEVGAIIHTHTRAGMAVSAQKQGLMPLTQTSMRFMGHIGYHDYEGPAINLEEQARLVADMGEHNALILKNHGLLTCGPTMGHAFNLMRRLESACESQVLAQAGGAKLIMPPRDVVNKTAGQTTRLVDKGADQTDGPGILWAAVRRWMTQLDPSYMD